MKKTNNKYNLFDLDVGEYKSFPLDIYDRIRMAAHFTGKRHDRIYSTSKMKKTVRVYRIR